MRKVNIFTPYFSKNMGGIENLSYNLYINLIKYFSENIRVYSSNVNNKQFEDNVYYAKNDKSKLKIGIELLIKSYLDIKKYKNYNNIINIALTWKMAIIPYIYKIFFGIPYITFIHGNDIYPYNNNIVRSKIIKSILKNSKVIIANSNYTKNICKNTYGDYNIKVIHPGINFKENTTDNVDNKESKILFTLSRLEKRKGIDNTIKALSKITLNYPEIQYYIGGKGSYKEELKRIVNKLNLQKNVTFLGFISEKEKERMYKLCDLFIMPSYEIREKNSVEGFGIVYLEANMYGKFVIGGKSGGISDAIINGETGFLVDGKNPDKISKAVNRFFKEYKEEKTYEAKCKNWAKKHDWDNVINEVINLL